MVLCAWPQPGWPEVGALRRGAQSRSQRPGGSEVAAGSRLARPPGCAALAATAGPRPLPLALPPPLRLLTLQRRLLLLSRARRGGGGPAGRERGGAGRSRGLACAEPPRHSPAARLPRRHALSRWGETAARRGGELWAAGSGRARPACWQKPGRGWGLAGEGACERANGTVSDSGPSALTVLAAPRGPSLRPHLTSLEQSEGEAVWAAWKAA